MIYGEDAQGRMESYGLKYMAKMRKAEWNHKNIHGKTCSFGIMNTCVLAFLFLRRIM